MSWFLTFVGTCMGHDPPAWVPDVPDRTLTAFSACPILVVREAQVVGHRVYGSTAMGRSRFAAWRRALCPDHDADRWFNLVGPDVRRMMDTNGASHALYLDDLQDVTHERAAPPGHVLMCDILELPSHRHTTMTRHNHRPDTLISPAARAWFDRTGMDGLWSVRWHSSKPFSVICINEDRHQGTVRAASQRLQQWLTDPGLHAAAELAAQRGLEVYPDAIEVHLDGQIDVTLGLAPRRS